MKFINQTGDKINIPSGVEQLLSKLESEVSITVSDTVNVLNINEYGRVEVVVEFEGTIDVSNPNTNPNGDIELYSSMSGDVFVSEISDSNLTLDVVPRN